jgi:hypothetical protein
VGGMIALADRTTEGCHLVLDPIVQNCRDNIEYTYSHLIMVGIIALM